MAAALPGSRSLFLAPLLHALDKVNRHQVRHNHRVFDDSLADFRAIENLLRDRPTRFRRLVPAGEPVTHGQCDAGQCCISGVWFRQLAPPSLVWHNEFSLALQQPLLVTSNNRTGIMISILDLKLAGSLVHKQILVQALPTFAERPTSKLAWR